MSDEITMPETAEEFQRALRDAFEDGAHWQNWNFPRQYEEGRTIRYDSQEVIAEARRRYPIRRRMPRVVEDHHSVRYRVVDGEVEYADGPHDPWLPISGAYLYATTERIRIWADLLADPYEEVEE